MITYQKCSKLISPNYFVAHFVHVFVVEEMYWIVVYSFPKREAKAKNMVKLLTKERPNKTCIGIDVIDFTFPAIKYKAMILESASLILNSNISNMGYLLKSRHSIGVLSKLIGSPPLNLLPAIIVIEYVRTRGF